MNANMKVTDSRSTTRVASKALGSPSYIRPPVAHRRPSLTSSRSRKPNVACNSVVEELEKAIIPSLLYDNGKEESRQYRRTVFTHEDWFRHRSTSRYVRHMRGLLQSRIVRGLVAPVGFVVTIASFVTVYELLRENGVLPEYCMRLVVDSSQPFNLTSFALSLLLVFRTNASYARWDEARKIWGGITNRTRDTVRQGLTYFGDDKQELKEMLGRWVSALPLTLKCHLTYDSDLETDLKREGFQGKSSDLQDVLPPHELNALLESEHRPNYVARVISEVIRAAEMQGTQIFIMDGNMTFFSDAVGKCERILSTPIPLSWTRHTSRFLVIWLGFLPFLLFSTCRYATVPVAAVISLLLLGIEEIGVSIEEPFSILPLDKMSAKMGNNIKEMLARKDACESLIAPAARFNGSANGRVPASRGFFD